MQLKSSPVRSTSSRPGGVLKPPYVHDGGLGWNVGVADPDGDSGADHFASTLCLYEDGLRLTKAHAFMDAIRRGGGGRYRHWNDGRRSALHFSSTDGSDPNLNGRIYSYDHSLSIEEWDDARRRDEAARWLRHPQGETVLELGGDVTPPPLVANLGLTNKCNLRCEICGSQKHLDATGIRRRHMDYRVFEAVAETLFPFLSQVELNSQGDPLLHPRIEDILATIARHRCEVKIQHNGTLLRDKVLDLVLRQHGEIMLSLDAVGSKFDDVRRGGDWSKASPGLERLLRERDAGRLSVGVYPTLTSRTIGEAPNIVRWCAERGVDEVVFHRYVPVEPSTETAPSEEEYAALRDELRAWCQAEGDPFRIQFEGELLNEHPAASRRVEYADAGKALAMLESGKVMFPIEAKRAGGDPFMSCAAPDEYVEIGLDGQMGACCRAQDVPLGYATSLPRFAEAWLGSNYAKLRRSLRRGATGEYVLPNCEGCVKFFAPGEARDRHAVDYSAQPAPGEERLEFALGEVVPIEGIQKEEGHCHIAVVPLGIRGEFELWEDDRRLGPGGTYHAEIRAHGEGRHHIGANSVYFSSSDGTDARRNGRIYSLRRKANALSTEGLQA